MKTRLGNKNGYFFEICKCSNFNGLMTLILELKIWPQMTPNNVRAFLNFLFIVNFSLVSIWKKLKASIILPSVSPSTSGTFRSEGPDKRTKTVLTFVSTSGISIFWNWSFLHSRLSNWIDKFGLLIYIGFRSSAYTLSITHHLWLINYESVIGSSPKSQVHRVFQVHFSQFLDDRKVLCLYKWTYGCLFFMPKGENKWNQTVTHHFSAFGLIPVPLYILEFSWKYHFFVKKWFILYL